MNIEKLKQLSSQELVEELMQLAFTEPFSDIKAKEKKAKSELGALLCYIDFEAYILSEGILGFINTDAAYFIDETIESFDKIGLNETSRFLVEVKKKMEKHHISIDNLRRSHEKVPEYSVISFSDIHGERFDKMAEDFETIPEKMFAESGSSEEETYIDLIERFTEKNFETIILQLERNNI